MFLFVSSRTKFQEIIIITLFCVSQTKIQNLSILHISFIHVAIDHAFECNTRTLDVLSGGADQRGAEHSFNGCSDRGDGVSVDEAEAGVDWGAEPEPEAVERATTGGSR